MGDPELEVWINSILILLALAAAGWFAWRRSQATDGQPPSRFLRVFYSAAAISGALTSLLVIGEALAEEGVSREIVPLVGLGASAFLAIGLALFGIADFWRGLLRPALTRRWLALAVVAFALLISACFLVVFWFAGETEALLRADSLQVVAIGAVSGIVWWSHLPLPPRDLAGLFE